MNREVTCHARAGAVSSLLAVLALGLTLLVDPAAAATAAGAGARTGDAASTAGTAETPPDPLAVTAQGTLAEQTGAAAINVPLPPAPKAETWIDWARTLFVPVMVVLAGVVMWAIARAARKERRSRRRRRRSYTPRQPPRRIDAPVRSTRPVGLQRGED